MKKNELVKAFPKLMEELCKDPAFAQKLEVLLTTVPNAVQAVEILCDNPKAASALATDEAAIMPIVQNTVVHVEADRTYETIRRARGFLSSRMDIKRTQAQATPQG